MSAALAPLLFEDMVGTWAVMQQMWAAADTDAVTLPAATARRRLVGGAFVEETMELEAGSQGDAFTRIAYFNFNAVDQRYEYFSLDTRAPQMMNERSRAGAAASAGPQPTIELFGDSFVAPRWGDSTDASFIYRLTVGPIEQNRQVVTLYLTPRISGTPKEFCAFEYVYTRRST